MDHIAGIQPRPTADIQLHVDRKQGKIGDMQQRGPRGMRLNPEATNEARGTAKKEQPARLSLHLRGFQAQAVRLSATDSKVRTTAGYDRRFRMFRMENNGGCLIS